MTFSRVERPAPIRATEAIRVVVFGGAYFEPAAQRFLVRLVEDPLVELRGVFCQGQGKGLICRIRDVVHRRGFFALPVLVLDGLRAFAPFVRNLTGEISYRRRLAAVLRQVEVVKDLHAPGVLARVRATEADLGLIYGSPILRPALFEIPRYGTLGIHHGKVPEYRGKKTTFWAVYNGERTAGVTVQRVNERLDGGEVVREGEVIIAGKSYQRVEAEVERLGIALYLDAIHAIRDGTATFRPQRRGNYGLYRQPRPRDFLRLFLVRRPARSRLA